MTTSKVHIEKYNATTWTIRICLGDQEYRIHVDEANPPLSNRARSQIVRKHIDLLMAHRAKFGPTAPFEAGTTNKISRNPPRIAEFLFMLLAPKHSVDAQLGDLQQLFEGRVKRYGAARGSMFYWTQVLRAIVPGVWRALTKWGFIGFIVDLGRKKLGL